MPYDEAMTKTFKPVADAAKKVGSMNALALLLGVQPPTVHQWRNGIRPVPVDKCLAIEKATGGLVTRKQLRPKDWHLIWPDVK